jgi:Fe-S cluster assembly protein SufD
MARVESLPLLKIFAQDVQCSHGTTVGGPDPDSLFYAQSRGLDRETAQNLLARAFIAEILEKIPQPSNGHSSPLPYNFIHGRTP